MTLSNSCATQCRTLREIYNSSIANSAVLRRGALRKDAIDALSRRTIAPGRNYLELITESDGDAGLCYASAVKHYLVASELLKQWPGSPQKSHLHRAAHVRASDSDQHDWVELPSLSRRHLSAQLVMILCMTGSMQQLQPIFHGRDGHAPNSQWNPRGQRTEELDLG